MVQAYIQRVENDRCVVTVNDNELSPSDNIFSEPPPAKFLHCMKGKGKCALYDSDDNEKNLLYSTIFLYEESGLGKLI